MDLVGKHLGRIEVLETLGEGGMGTVYLGWDSALERRVALKALRHGRELDDENRARFLREARILSQLEHPSICRIHDLIEEGTDEVLVLEYVEGRTLTEAMDSGLSPSRRLAIARQLAEALVAAHAAGIVHRDLKPDNVLVTPEGLVKVLDFGLARSLPPDHPDEEGRGDETDPSVTPGGPELPPSAPDPEPERVSGVRSPPPGVVLDDTWDVRTQIGSVVGSVATMSPEQAKGETVTLSSDMYSLGIILHELFTGSPAYPRGLSLAERLQAVAEARTKPVRGVDPELADLIERLESPRPENRPRAADVLARLDWLAGRPRRRRRRVAAAIAVLLLAGLGLRHHLRLRAEQQRTVAALQEAERREHEARRVSELLVDVFEVSDPGSALGREVTARELLQNGARRVEAGLEEQPLLRARLLETLGHVHEHLGLYDDASQHYESAWEIYRETHQGDHVDTARARALLGDLRRFQDRYAEAAEHLEESLAMQRRSGAPGGLLSTTLLGLGRLRHDQGEVAVAGQLLEEAERAWSTRGIAPDRTLAHILEAKAEVANDLGRYEEAERLFVRAVDVLEAEIGEEHPALATLRTNLGAVLLEAGHLARAERHFRESLRVRSEVLPADHPNLAISWSYVALAAASRGELEEAEACYHRALRIFRAAVGPKHYNVGAALALLGALYVDSGRWDEADDVLAEAAAIWEELDLRDSYNAILVRSEQARAAAARGNWDEAVVRAREVLAAWLATSGEGVPEAIEARIALGEALAESGRVEEAREKLGTAVRQARETVEREAAPEARRSLARALIVTGEVEKDLEPEGDAGQATLEEALGLLEAGAEEVSVRAMRARALVALGRADEARDVIADLRQRGWVDRRLVTLANGG